MRNRRNNLIFPTDLEDLKNIFEESDCIYPGDKAMTIIFEVIKSNNSNQGYEQKRNNLFRPSQNQHLDILEENRKLKEKLDQYQELLEENNALTKEYAQLKNLVKQLEMDNEKSNNLIKELQVKNNELQQQPVNKVIEEEYSDIMSNMQNIANLFTNYTNNIADFKRSVNAFKYYSQFEKLIELVKKINDYIDFNHKNNNDKINMIYLNPLKIELVNIIKNFGIEEYIPNCGDEYNSEFHQTEKPINYQTKIKECKNPGYKYENNVISKAEVEVFTEREVY